MQQAKHPFCPRLQLLAWLALNAGKHTGNQTTRLAHLDDGNDRAILVQGDEGPAQSLPRRRPGSFGWGIRALHQLATATMVPFPRRLPHTISLLEGDGFEPSVPPREKPTSSPVGTRFRGACRNPRRPDRGSQVRTRLVWGFSCQAVVFGFCCQFFVRSGKGRSSSRRLRSGSRRARKGSRDRNASGAWRRAALASLVFRSALTPEKAEGR